MPGARSPIGSLRAALARSPAAGPALAAVAVFLALAGSDGGFSELTWYPAGLFVLALLAVALVSVPSWARLPRPTALAVALLAAYALWSYLSIAWADQRGEAWDGANRAALYAAVFALFALWPLRARAAATVVGAFALGVAGAGLIELLAATGSSEPGEYFIGGRFAEPVGYPNGNVALWFAAVPPCLILGSRREVHPGLRGLLLGGAVLLTGLALMGQSRGWAFALPAVALILFAVTPGRVRLFGAALVVALAAVAVGGVALDVHDVILDSDPAGPPLDRAARAILIAAGVTVAIGVVWGLVERRVRVGPVAGRRAGIALLALGALALGTGATIFVGREGDPVAYVGDAWAEFKTGPQPRGNVSRFGQTLGSNRYDFWRVAWGNFGRHPVAGVGAENFQQDYLERRRSSEEPRHPHSFELRVLSQTGLPGAVLVFGGLGAALFAAMAAIRRRRGIGAAAAAAGTMGFVYWLVHGSVDWFWELPALSVAAFAMLGVAAGLLPREPRPAGALPLSAPPLGRRAPMAAAGAAAVALCASMFLPWLAERNVESAAATWREDPGKAFRRLDRAASLNPLSSRPALVAGTIALRLGQLDRAEREFRSALRDDPRSAYAVLELGAIASQRGRTPEARALLERAVRLDSRDRTSGRALERVRAGERLDVGQINRELLKRARRRLR